MTPPPLPRRRQLLAASAALAAPAWFLAASAPTTAPAASAISAAAASRLRIGHFAPAQLKGRRITLPRLHLYDAKGQLVPREHWPAATGVLTQHAGDAFCCVSDTPQPPGASGPPPDCKVLVYGEDIQEHFTGLLDAADRPLRRQDLPSSRFLLVDWYADWCAPCVPGLRTLEAFLVSPAGRDYAALVVDFTNLMPKAGAKSAPKG